MYITWFHTSTPSWNLRPKKLRSPCKKSVVGTWHAWSGSKRWSLLPLLDLTCPKLRKRSSYLEKCDIAIKKQKSMHDGDFNQIYVVQKHYSQLAKRRDGVRFALRHGDNDITVMLETTVPPADLASISIFANALGKFNSQVRLSYNTCFGCDLLPPNNKEIHNCSCNPIPKAAWQVDQSKSKKAAESFGCSWFFVVESLFPFVVESLLFEVECPAVVHYMATNPIATRRWCSKAAGMVRPFWNLCWTTGGIVGSAIGYKGKTKDTLFRFPEIVDYKTWSLPSPVGRAFLTSNFWMIDSNAGRRPLMISWRRNAGWLGCRVWLQHIPPLSKCKPTWATLGFLEFEFTEYFTIFSQTL